MTSLGIADYGGFLLGAVLIILLPGPNSMYVLSVAAREGARRGYVAAAVVFVSDSVLMLASVGGVASLLRAHPSAFLAVKYAGAAYLAWIGARLVLGGLRALTGRGAADEGEVPDAVEPAVGSDADLAHARRSRNPFVGAVVLGLLNPKSILFFIAFFVQFVDPSSPHATTAFLVLAATLQVVSMTYLTALILGGIYLAARFRAHARLAGAATMVVGVVFVGFAARLATASL